MKRVFNHTGQRFGRLVVLKDDPDRRYYCLCRCDCGTVKSVRAGSLREGSIVSCGCRMRETGRENGRVMTTHGKTHTPEYRAWLQMRNRCYRPNHTGYKYWGGRGIVVCTRWKDSFEAFFADMGLKPSPKHSLDRINNDGNYEPNNCRWATPAEQVANRRPINGRSLCQI